MIARNRERIAIKDFRDFTVILQLQEEHITGYLGNISEMGLNFVCSIETELPAVSNQVSGQIVSKRLERPLEFTGRIAWHSVVTYKNTDRLSCGIEFTPSIDLPDVVIALSLSANE